MFFTFREQFANNFYFQSALSLGISDEPTLVESSDVSQMIVSIVPNANKNHKQFWFSVGNHQYITCWYDAINSSYSRPRICQTPTASGNIRGKRASKPNNSSQLNWLQHFRYSARSIGIGLRRNSNSECGRRCEFGRIEWLIAINQHTVISCISKTYSY